MMSEFLNGITLNWAQRIVLFLYGGFCLLIVVALMDLPSNDFAPILWPLTLAALAFLLGFKKNP